LYVVGTSHWCTRSRIIAIGIPKTEQKKNEKVPLRKGRVPKIIVGARGHPETYVDPPLGGLMSLRSAARTPFRVRPPSLRFPSCKWGVSPNKDKDALEDERTFVAYVK